MMLEAQLKLPTEVVFQDPTPNIYIDGVSAPQKPPLQPPPIAYCNNNGRMRCWSWEPEQEYWGSIGSHYHPPR